MRILGFFIVLVLAVGCRSQQPAVFAPCNTDTVTLVDSTTIIIKDKEALKSLLECDSLNNVQWCTTAELAYLLDSISAIEAKIIYKNKIVYKTLHTVIDKVIYRDKDKIVYKLHPITWVFAFIMLLLLIFLLIRK